MKLFSSYPEIEEKRKERREKLKGTKRKKQLKNRPELENKERIVQVPQVARSETVWEICRIGKMGGKKKKKGLIAHGPGGIPYSREKTKVHQINVGGETGDGSTSFVKVLRGRKKAGIIGGNET